MNPFHAPLTITALLAAGAEGAIVSFTGQTVHLTTPPPFAIQYTLTSNDAYAWDELPGVSASGVWADMTANPGSSGSPTPGAVSGIFDSHMIHFSDWHNHGGGSAQGSVTFDNRILAVIFDDQRLDQSDPAFNHPSVVNSTGWPGRGMTPPSTLSINHKTLRFHFVDPYHLDQVRVLTAPAPGSTAAAAAVGAILLARRRRRAG